MDGYCFFSSVTRCSDLWQRPFEVRPRPRGEWQDADFVLGEVVGRRNALFRCETKTGRIAELAPGDRLVGALGARAATLEGVGDWREVGEDLVLDALTGAGLLGKATSTSLLLPEFMPVAYRGHLWRDDRALGMGDFVKPVEPRPLNAPLILVIGTSMSAGKTSSARVIIRELVSMGLRVVASKLTGAARFRDIVSFRDSGAAAVFDFVDEGLPSTACTEDTYAPVLSRLLSRIASAEPDVVVAEAGASPLEPYNGTLAVNRIRSNTSMTLLCASDPYAVVGVQAAFGLKPDLVAGPAANTSAAVALVRRLAGLQALNLMDVAAREPLRAMLADRLGLGAGTR